MPNVKLHINLSQGIIDAEGEEGFVWKVYEDFRDRLNWNVDLANTPEVDAGASEEEEEVPTYPIKQPSKKGRSKRSSPNKGTKTQSPGLSSYKPRLVDNLDTNGIKDFIASYAMTNHANNIVGFVKFLESKGRKPATFDEIYTCYRDAGLRIPEAFAQAFMDTRGKKSFIQFSGPTDVELTLRGSNHIEHGGMNNKDKAA